MTTHNHNSAIGRSSAAGTSASDDALRKLFAESLPEAPKDEWFTRKVMNRLPDKPARRKQSIMERVCYAIGILGLLSGWGYAASYTLTNGLTANMLIIAAVLPLITLFCISIFAIPAIKRAL